MTAPGGLDDVVDLDGTPSDHDQGLDPEAIGEQDPLDDLPALADWPPPEILERWAKRRADQVHRRSTRRRGIALVAMIALVAVGVAALTRGSTHPLRKTPGVVTVKPGSVALSLDLGFERVVAVVSVPDGIAPSVVAVPGAAKVDITGGEPLTVAEAAATPGLMVAAVQAALDRRVDHYVAFDANAMTNLVDSLGGVDVQTEAEFAFGAQLLGPGPEHLTGGAVIAYLLQATPEDVDARWEEVLSGVFSAKAAASAWDALIGQSDTIEQARVLLARADGAIVLELPTAPTLDGGIEVDGTASAGLVSRNFGPVTTRLVRVIVLNGTGDPNLGQDLAGRLSLSGFRVVAAQDAVSFSVTQTEIVAAGEALVPDAERVQALLGVGMVYVDAQPTGIADITIKVGKDFQSV